ncbi:hypothetical protein GGR50DRAFT_94700 [Xylaria sp. CBS 124048]|nr:hypothetical protein GGR50DRAFT_94700 [Xylaria sp. CBS 124048]
MSASATTMSASAAQTQDSPLVRALARVLPKDTRFTAWHLSTTPALTEALCYPPALNSTTEKRPSKPLKTYCEKHFLALSIPVPEKTGDVLVLGLEIYIYSTVFSTTIFVAKADSTGYLDLLSTPQGFSPIRAVTAAFLEYLVEHRRRRSKQLIINLFARAQSQYLFPGSVENDKKHILDDRGLIRWWCRVLNPLLEQDDQNKSTRNWRRIHGYLVVPGLDPYETRAFIPRTEKAKENWTLGDPLELISPYNQDTANFANAPLRCLIPTYPDDPKARFVEELEESTSEQDKLVAGWKTPKTLDQFWEMMSFRQECSSGRMTGFVWIVFEPLVSMSLPERPSTKSANPLNSITNSKTLSMLEKSVGDGNLLAKPAASSSKSIPDSAGLPRPKCRGKQTLTGPIRPLKARVKTHRANHPARIVTPYYYWPATGRGQVVLDESGYTRAVELLLHLEFKGLEQAIASTSRWVNEVNMGDSWALPIIGKRIVSAKPVSSSSGSVNNLAGSIITKRKKEDEPGKDATPGQANVLGEGLIRKKAKVDAEEKPTEPQSGSAAVADPVVNVLGSGLVRKKTKPV